MKHKFTLFVQKHHGGEHTVIVVEVPDIRAHHVVLDKCRDQVCRALAKRIRRIEPSALAGMKPRRDQEIKAVRVELRPRGRKGMPRRNRIEIKFSLIISNYDEDHILVRVPKLLDPLSGSRLFAFLVRREEDLRSVAQQELQVYFQDYSLERLLEFGYAKSETIETVTVLAEPKRAMDREEEREEESCWGLESAGEKLTTKERAKANRAYEMDEFVEEILETLASKQRNSVLLVGPPQVGKSAVIDEVARRIVRKECDRALHRRDIWRISAQSIEAPKVWWEGVLKNIVEEAERKNIILCLENITDFLEGATSFTRGAEMARFLKPYIASGQIVFIAETTLERYGAHAGRSGGFLEQFKTIRLEEPPIPKVRRILNAVRTALEPRYSASVEPGCIDTVIELTRRFQPYSAFPGKGVILLEQAVLSVARGGKGREKRRISRKDVIRQFSLQSGMPEFILSDDRRLKMSDVRRFFSDRVMGQEEAVKAAANLISVVKAGMNDPDKPLGTFIFIGPTGVGKTEMAKTIAEYLFGSAERLSRLDMSEYSSIEAVEKLVGLPGDPRGGNLTRKVIEQPFTVLLLDEIEKARPEVFDLLLQVLGEGRLTTSAGLTADFRNSIIIMTSNLGASHREMKSLGFRASDGQGGADHYLQKMEEFFRPEFINRIDRVVLFRPLSREAMRAIARKELESVVLREGLLRRDCLVEIDDGLVDLLVERGFSPSYGARPLKREIERLVTQRIADYLSSHPGERLPLLRVSREGDGARIEAVEMREVKETVAVQRSDSLAGGDVAKRKIGIHEISRGFSEIRRRLREHLEGEKVEELRRQKTAAVKETSDPNFWNRSAEVRRAHMKRIYHLERLLKRLDQLHRKAEDLEELSQIVLRQRDQRYLPELAESYGDLQQAFSFLDIEIGVANLKDVNSAVIGFRPAGGQRSSPSSGLEWFKVLLKMYLSWLHLKGFSYDLRRLVLPGNGKETPRFTTFIHERFEDLSREISSLSRPETIFIHAEGVNVYGFLRGEDGLHRLKGSISEEAPGFRTDIVQVSVSSIQDASSFEWWMLKFISDLNRLQREEKCSCDEAARRLFDVRAQRPKEIVRRFELEGRPRVVDPRTGVEIREWKRVLGGYLDPFILEFVRAHAGEMDQE